MGAEQSSTQDGHGVQQGSEAVIRCYYDVLGVSRDANQDEYDHTTPSNIAPSSIILTDHFHQD